MNGNLSPKLIENRTKIVLAKSYRLIHMFGGETMKQSCLIVLCTCCLLGCSCPTTEDQDTPQLEELEAKRVSFLNDYDFDSWEVVAHTKSPSMYPPGKFFTSGRWEEEHGRKFGWTLISVRLVAVDLPFAYARVQVDVYETDTKVGNRIPLRRDDQLVAYRKEEGVWKRWSAMTIESRKAKNQDTEQAESTVPVKAAPSASSTGR